MKIGYVPYSSSLDMPGDRRRFVFYAETKGLTFEIADPSKKYDVVVLSERADLSVWSRYRHAKIVFDLIDSYLAIPQSDVRGLLRGVSKFAFRQTKWARFRMPVLLAIAAKFRWDLQQSRCLIWLGARDITPS